jgi:hypothetical protein
MKTSGIVVFAAGAALVGLLVGVGIGRSGKSELAERADQHDELVVQVTALEDRLGTIEGRFDGLSQDIGSLSTGLEDQSNQFAAVSDRIGKIGENVSGAVSGAVSGLSADLSGALSERFGSLSNQLAAMQTAAPGSESLSGEIVAPGETLKIGDDAARVFLSSVSADSRSARVAVNGTGLQTLRIGQSVELGGCKIMLTGIEPPSAMIDGSCDGQGEVSKQEAPSSAPAGLGKGTEIAVAEVASLADGAVRVFLSQFDPSSGKARIAINGTKTTVLGVGESVKAGDCTISLTGMGETSVSIDASC